MRRYPWPRVALAGLCVVAAAAMGALAINFFLAGKWYLADVGNIQQCLYNTLHGRFMWSPITAHNHFATHFTPTLLGLLPLVWLSPYPIPLVLAYQAGLALTPVPLYVLARQRGLPAGVSLAAGVWFLCNHFVGSLQLANHFENFYVLFALATMAAIGAHSRVAWWIFALLAMGVKEDCAVWLLGFAAWAVMFERNPVARQRARWLAGLCVVYIGIASAVMLLVSGESSIGTADFIERMGGISIGRDNLWVLFLLIASSGGVALLNWRAALLLLVPLPVILGNFEFTRHLLYYYSYPFLPFLAFATVAGLGSLWHRWPSLSTSPVAARVIALLMVGVGLAQYALPTRTDEYRRLPLPLTIRDTVRRHVASHVLPVKAPVAVQFGLWGVTPSRPDMVFLRSDQLQDHHYVFLDARGIHGLAPAENRQVVARLKEDLESGRRREVYDAYDFIILSPATTSPSQNSLDSPG